MERITEKQLWLIKKIIKHYLPSGELSRLRYGEISYQYAFYLIWGEWTFPEALTKAQASNIINQFKTAEYNISIIQDEIERLTFLKQPIPKELILKLKTLQTTPPTL